MKKNTKKIVKVRDLAAAALATGRFKRAVHADAKKVADKSACRKWKGE